jgi:membrane protein required for colicin V production
MHWSQWTFSDCFFAGIILLSTGIAIAKGFVRELVSLVALIGGLILAAVYYPVMAGSLIEFCRTETVANLAGFVIIFSACLLLGSILGFVINRFIKAASLGYIDRLLGGVFGLLRGWAIASVLVLGLIAFPVRENLMSHSFLAPYLLAGARTAALLVPQHLKDQFNEQYKKVLHAWNQSRSAS